MNYRDKIKFVNDRLKPLEGQLIIEDFQLDDNFADDGMLFIPPHVYPILYAKIIPYVEINDYNGLPFIHIDVYLSLDKKRTIQKLLKSYRFNENQKSKIRNNKDLQTQIINLYRKQLKNDYEGSERVPTTLLLVYSRLLTKNGDTIKNVFDYIFNEVHVKNGRLVNLDKQDFMKTQLRVDVLY